MCVVKTPKIKPTDSKPPEPTVIRNPYLDGVDPITRASRQGRSSLRIDRSRAGSVRPSAPPMAVAPVPTPSPVLRSPGPALPGITPPMGGGRSVSDLYIRQF